VLLRIRRLLARLIVGERADRIGRMRSSWTLRTRRGFDADWYALVSATSLSRGQAVKHYLEVGAKNGYTPHPLWDRDYYRASGRARATHLDDFAAYLRDKSKRNVPTHPLFDLGAYLALAPEALAYRGGPIEHYRVVGEAAGLAPNSWLDLGQERGLVTWLRARAGEWSARRVLVRAERRSPTYDRAAEAKLLQDFAGVQPVRAAGYDVLVTVVIPVWNRADEVSVAIDSIVAQTLGDWELLVVDDGSTDDIAGVLGRYAGDPRIRLVTVPHGGVGKARNAGIRQARGQYLAWLDSDDWFTPDHLRVLVAFMQRDGLRAGYDILELRAPGEPSQYRVLDGGRDYLELANHIGQTVLVHERSLVDEIGEYAEDLPRTVDYDFILRIAKQTRIALAPFVGCVVNHDPADRTRITRTLPDSWTDVVIGRNVVDWAAMDAAAEQPRDPRSVSVVIPTPNEYEMTLEAVRSVRDAAATSDLDVEVVVVDNGTGLVVSAVLASLPHRFDQVKVVTSPRNRGFALGNNIAVPYVAGSTVVALNNDTVVTPGWLEPLVDALADPAVLGAQSLLAYPTGSIQSAGVVFPSCGGIPHVLLQGFPLEDADGMADQELHALTGAALALRFADVVALRGFDPIYRNGMEDIDLCLRLAQRRPGSFRVLPASVVEHYESRSPGRGLHHLDNREILLERWGVYGPQDDVRQWRQRGFEVVGYEVKNRAPARSHLSVPVPVLRHLTPSDPPRPTALTQVTELPTRLRWAIKNPAPAHLAGKLWGDTHFAEGVAQAMRDLGQHVAIDANQEFARGTGHHDDVVLVLRGLTEYFPVPGQVNLLWVISHPELVTADEVRGYDQVFAASIAWARSVSRDWKVRVDPLLQATDPSLFHPQTGKPDTGDPVLFVGNSRLVLRPLVRDALQAELPVTVYGADWTGLVPDEVVAGVFIPNEQLAAHYRSAGVVLNDHWEDMRTSGFLSNRLFDAVASGARVISDDVAGLAEVFGDRVKVSRSPAELRALASGDLDLVFGPDDGRLVAAAEVAHNHSFNARARELIDAALTERARWRDRVDSPK
jgi:O-antigen biosynthesis protein